MFHYQRVNKPENHKRLQAGEFLEFTVDYLIDCIYLYIYIYEIILQYIYIHIYIYTYYICNTYTMYHHMSYIVLMFLLLTMWLIQHWFGRFALHDPNARWLPPFYHVSLGWNTSWSTLISGALHGKILRSGQLVCRKKMGEFCEILCKGFDPSPDHPRFL